MNEVRKKQSSVVLRYFGTLTSVLLLYGAYSILAVPALEGSAGLKASSIQTTRILPDHSSVDGFELEDIFEPGSWELGPCKTLATRFGKILFKKYQPNDDGTILIQPITMILSDRRESQGKVLPFVLQSAKGAVLKFDKPISLGEPVGHLEGGRFLGAVNLFRKNLETNQLDVLLETQNLQFSEKRIYTLEDISFRFGPHSGSGRNMNIELVDDDVQARQTKSDSRLRGVKFLEVAKLDELILQPTSDKSSFENQFQQLEKPPVIVKCKGTFKIDFQAQAASLYEKVTVTQQGIGEYSHLRDQLSSDRLRIDFSNRQIEQVQTSTKKDKWEVDRLVAVGAPAVLDFQSKNAQAIAEFLEYDMKEARVVARNIDESKTIYLRHGAKELEAKDIDYKIDENGRLGSLRSYGPGKLVVRSAKSSSVTEVYWKERFDIRTHNGKKVASMYGGVTIVKKAGQQLPSSTIVNSFNSSGAASNWRMTARELHVWLLEDQNTLVPKSANQNVAASDDPKIVPEKIFADGNVVIDSDKLHVETNEIKAFWPNEKIGASNQRSVSVSAIAIGLMSIKPASAYATVNNSILFVQSPDQEYTRVHPQVETTAKTQRFFVEGDSIQLQMKPYNQNVEISELTVDGNANLWRYNPEGLDKALDVTGGQLRWIPKREDLARVIVSGKPNENARLFANGAELYGPDIVLDQVVNKAWIEGPGYVHVNRQQKAVPKVAKNEANGGPQKLTVRWVGGMIFDGKQIYFEQNVSTKGHRAAKTGEVSVLDASSQSMTAKLVKPFSFSKIENSDAGKELEISSITLIGHLDRNGLAFPDLRSEQSRNSRTVAISSQVFKNNQVIERTRINLPAISIHDRLNKIDGEGPGLFRSTRLNEQGQLSYSRLEFERDIKGRMDDQYLDVRGHVRCVQANIVHWDQEFEIDDVITTENKMTRLFADQIQIAKWAGKENQRSMGEFTAVGNAQVTGFDYDAEANRISFDQRTNKIVIVGGPRSDATIRYVQPGQSKPSLATAERIDYFKDTQEAKFHNLKRIVTEHRSGQSQLNLNRK